MKNGEWFVKEKRPLEYDRCTKEDFASDEEYDKLNFNTWFCPKLNNLEFGGHWDETDARFFSIGVSKCPQGG
jgi:hypothetical protein